MSGAYTTVASGYQSIGVNPANLASNKSLSINIISGNLFLLNDFMSMDLYNNLNGADFDNTASASYYAKSDILDQIKGSEIEIESGVVMPFPVLNFAYKNFGISSLNRTYTKFDIPKTVVDKSTLLTSVKTLGIRSHLLNESVFLFNVTSSSAPPSI